jgi:hypothetical protein
MSPAIFGFECTSNSSDVGRNLEAAFTTKEAFFLPLIGGVLSSQQLCFDSTESKETNLPGTYTSQLVQAESKSLTVAKYDQLPGELQVPVVGSHCSSVKLKSQILSTDTSMPRIVDSQKNSRTFWPETMAQGSSLEACGEKITTRRLSRRPPAETRDSLRRDEMPDTKSSRGKG